MAGREQVGSLGDGAGHGVPGGAYYSFVHIKSILPLKSRMASKKERAAERPLAVVNLGR